MGRGYLSSEYARAFAGRGQLLQLPRSGGWLLLRPIPAAPLVDATGLYPLMACRDWAALSSDLDGLDGRIVSVVAVADPLGDHEQEQLAHAFPAVMRPYKDHLVVDTAAPFATDLPSNHRRNIRRAARALDVEVDVAPAVAASDWVRLYGELVRRHDIRGLAAFTGDELITQLAVPGVRIARAVLGEETVAMQVWFVEGERGYYHLGASSPAGYEHAAAFALLDVAVRHLADEVRLLDLGAGPGLSAEDGGGLVRFKRPWANRVEKAYLCGRISAQTDYRRLADGSGGTFFPAYRRALPPV